MINDKTKKGESYIQKAFQALATNKTSIAAIGVIATITAWALCSTRADEKEINRPAMSAAVSINNFFPPRP